MPRPLKTHHMKAIIINLKNSLRSVINIFWRPAFAACCCALLDDVGVSEWKTKSLSTLHNSAAVKCAASIFTSSKTHSFILSFSLHVYPHRISIRCTSFYNQTASFIHKTPWRGKKFFAVLEIDSC